MLSHALFENFENHISVLSFDDLAGVADVHVGDGVGNLVRDGAFLKETDIATVFGAGRIRELLCHVRKADTTLELALGLFRTLVSFRGGMLLGGYQNFCQMNSGRRVKLFFVGVKIRSEEHTS